MQDCFAFSNAGLGRFSVMKHRIETEDAKPISRASYPTAWKQRDQIRRQVEEMLDLGIVEEAMGPWASPVLLVPKKDGSLRLGVDYRKLAVVIYFNESNWTIVSDFSLDRFSDALDRVQKWIKDRQTKGVGSCLLSLVTT